MINKRLKLKNFVTKNIDICFKNIDFISEQDEGIIEGVLYDLEHYTHGVTLTNITITASVTDKNFLICRFQLSDGSFLNDYPIFLK